MKTTLISLNEKLAVLTDIKNDAEDFKGSFGESENQRGGLQVTIVKTSEKITMNTKLNDDKHKIKIDTIKSKDDEIQ